MKIILFDIDNVLVQALGAEHWKNVVAQVKARFGVDVHFQDFWDRIYYLDKKDKMLADLTRKALRMCLTIANNI